MGRSGFFLGAETATTMKSVRDPTASLLRCRGGAGELSYFGKQGANRVLVSVPSQGHHPYHTRAVIEKEPLLVAGGRNAPERPQVSQDRRFRDHVARCVRRVVTMNNNGVKTGSSQGDE